MEYYFYVYFCREIKIPFIRKLFDRILTLNYDKQYFLNNKQSIFKL